MVCNLLSACHVPSKDSTHTGMEVRFAERMSDGKDSSTNPKVLTLPAAQVAHQNAKNVTDSRKACLFHGDKY
eukprot:4636475-Amphidinium_carterae.1